MTNDSVTLSKRKYYEFQNQAEVLRALQRLLADFPTIKKELTAAVEASGRTDDKVFIKAWLENTTK